MKILVVEDHPKLRKNILKYLSLKWFKVEEAIHWEEAIAKISNSEYDTIVLDINMPLINWKEFTKIIRAKQNSTPIIALTSNSALSDKLEMFNLWVDDYLTKPFDLEELEARIKTLWSRKDKELVNIIKHKDVEIDLWKHKVFKSWFELELGNKEYLILEFLAINKWYPKNKLSILEKVWWEQEENLNMASVTVEAHISYLRKKLGKDIIKTIKWVWYVIE